tara:strand:+ start:3609 stop:6191 length:2583 start_codon:yes stop_codon:yes gene_type:complete
MIYKKRSIKILYFFVLILFFLIFSKLDIKSIKYELREINEIIQSNDLGYSSLRSLLGINKYEDYGSRTNQVIQVSKKIFYLLLNDSGRIIKSKISNFPDRHSIETINIHIKNKDFLEILNDRKKALKNEILENSNFVDAIIIYKNKKIKAEIRLKGDLKDHWASKRRMSLRVKLKNNNSINTFNRFSLHKADARRFPDEPTFQSIVQEAGFLSVNHDYVKVRVNGISWGVMNIEEHISKELIEKLKVKESIIFKFGDDKKWVFEKKILRKINNYLLSNPYLYQYIFQENKYLSDVKFRKMYSYIIEKIEQKKYLEIFDKKNISQIAFFNMIWGSYHSLDFGNSRYYLNPYTLKLEHISSDTGPASNFSNRLPPKLYSDILYSNTNNEFNQNKEYALNNFKNYNKFLNFQLKYFPNDKSNFNHIALKNNIEDIKKLNLQKFKSLKKVEEEKKIDDVNLKINQIQSFPEYIKVAHYDNGDLKITNLLTDKIKIENIKFKDKFIEFSPIYIEGSKQNSIKNKIIKTNITGIQDYNFIIEASFKGKIIKHNTSFTIMKNQFNPLENSFSNEDFLIKDKNNWSIKKGVWKIEKPIIIEGDLIIEKGTKLLFSKDSYLIVKGSVKSIGTKDEPIIFTGINSSWKGVYIYSSSKKSHLEYCDISKTNSLNSGILNLEGGVNFYMTDVLISNSNFSNNFSEDALNVVKSNFSIINTNFENIYSDAFDSDFSSGDIKKSFFKNINGDAIDFSGSKSFIDNVSIENINDKGISVGENSNIMIHNSKIKNSKIGIATKDGSVTKVYSSNFIKNYLYDVMTFQKKSFYTEPSLEFFSKKNFKNLKFMRQVNTSLKINNQLIKEEKFNINSIY